VETSPNIQLQKQNKKQKQKTDWAETNSLGMTGMAAETVSATAPVFPKL
jgi:hypothetical protein